MEPKHKSMAVWIAIIIIVLILIAFTLYYLKPGEGTTPPPAAGAPEDSVASIQSDLQGLNVDGLDSELADIDKELNQ